MSEKHSLEGKHFENVTSVECIPDVRVCTFVQEGAMRKIDDIDSLLVTLKANADVDMDKYSTGVHSPTHPMMCTVVTGLVVKETSFICEQKLS